MTARALINVLGSRGLPCVETATGWQARCPAHQDHKPSLSISEGNDGRILLHCHAGCTIDVIVGALGLKPADLFSPASIQHGAPARIVKTYDYTDENGARLFQCVRFDPKDFRQRRPDPTKPGEWFWNLQGVRRVLYRLPELGAALAAGRTIFVAEGEKDVDTLIQNGFAATTNPMGAGKWQSEHTETLRKAARVAVLVDKDTPGRKHAHEVAAALLGGIKSVKLIELPDRGGKPVKDTADWFAAGGTADELQAIVKATPDYVSTPAAEQAVGTSGSQADCDWPDPKPLPESLPPVPPFNFDCLPGTLRPWLEDISERMQCPPDFAAVGAVIVTGSLVGRKIALRPKRADDWQVICNLWGLIVGRPGVMKTPALEQAMAALRSLAREKLLIYEAAIKEHEANAMLEEERVKLTKRSIQASLSKGEEEAARQAAMASITDPYVKPVLRRYEVNDVTIEKLGELLAENPVGLLLHRDELTGFLRTLDREGNEQARSIYLEAWNGTGEFTVDRIGRGTIRVPSNTVSIVGGIQPDLLASYVKGAVRGGMGADGLLQRFQVAVWPDPSNQWRNVDRKPDAAAREAAFEVFRYLDNLTAHLVGADTSGAIPFLRFTPEAQELFDLWRSKWESQIRAGAEHPAFESHLVKYRKLIPAMALILHLANGETGPVTRLSLDKALIWADYLQAHARRIYSAALRPDTAAARELAKRVQRGELGSVFSIREIYRKHWTGLDTKEDVEAATEILCDLAWLRVVQSEAPQPGRPSSPTFAINPKTVKNPLQVSAKSDKTLDNAILALLAPASPPFSKNTKPVLTPVEPARSPDQGDDMDSQFVDIPAGAKVI